MTRGQKVLTYAVGFSLGVLILFLIPRGEKRDRGVHPWHAQTAPEGTYPMEVVDDLGRTVRLERQPRHFISLAPSITEILFAMDMGDHLMAVTQWCTHPQEARDLVEAGAHVGSIDQPDREMIAAYRPDLIIGTDLTPPGIYSILENPPRTVALGLRHENMDDILEDVKLIGLATGVPGKALSLSMRLRDDRAAVDQRLARFREEPKRRVLFLISIEEGGQPGWTPGRSTWISHLIESAHGENAAAQFGTSWGEVSFEALLTLNPEVLLVREAETPAAQAQLAERVARLASHPVWKQVNAVQNHRIHWIPYGPVTVPGPRVIEAYDSIARAIWPEE